MVRISPLLSDVLGFLAQQHEQGQYAFVDIKEIVDFLVETGHLDSGELARSGSTLIQELMRAREIGLVIFEKDEPRETFKVKLTTLGAQALFWPTT